MAALMPKRSVEKPTTVDCAIIGGGVAGLYAGWRLATGASVAQSTDAPGSLAVFEHSERLGGRLDTGTVGGTPVEFGAMRYLPAQKLLDALLHAGLPGLSTTPFVSTQLQILYLRGVFMRPLASTPSPYQLVGAEKDKSALELLAGAIEALVPGALELTPAQWEVATTRPVYDGYALYQLGLWNVLSMVLSNEAYKYVFDALGIESVLSNWNAAEGLQLLTFILRALAGGPPGAFHRLVDGWSRLTDTLAAQLSAHGGEIHRQHTLVALLPQHGHELSARDEEYVDVAAIKAAITDSIASQGGDLHASHGMVTLV
ncbi:MAG TPA: FAD-dependent oxidoreductase, partial [Nannocystis sp.]